MKEFFPCVLTFPLWPQSQRELFEGFRRSFAIDGIWYKALFVVTQGIVTTLLMENSPQEGIYVAKVSDSFLFSGCHRQIVANVTQIEPQEIDLPKISFSLCEPDLLLREDLILGKEASLSLCGFNLSDIEERDEEGKIYVLRHSVSSPLPGEKKEREEGAQIVPLRRVA